MNALTHVKEFYLRLWCYPLSKRVKVFKTLAVGLLWLVLTSTLTYVALSLFNLQLASYGVFTGGVNG